jgi:hypothetical protein
MATAEEFLSLVWSDQAVVVQVAAVLLLLVVAFLSGRYFGRRFSPAAAAQFDGDFSQAVSCDTCDRPLRLPGGILFGPPTAKGFARQQHICVGCYPLFVATVVSIVESSKRLEDTVVMHKGDQT